MGLILFTRVLAKVPQQNVGTLFLLALLAQMVVSAAHQTYMNSGITISKGIGFAAAVLAAILLTGHRQKMRLYILQILKLRVKSRSPKQKTARQKCERFFVWS